MINHLCKPTAGSRRIFAASLVLPFLIVGMDGEAFGQFAQPGDFNGDGMVSQADLSVIGDGFNSKYFLNDYYLYVANYGQTASQPADLPLTITAVPTPAGNLEWTFTFANVNGALGCHLNITANSPTILSATGGPLFKDDGRDPVGAPGINASHKVEEGISFKGATAFAALGTTLTLSPSLLNSNSTLEFLRLVTAGVQPTTLTYAGEYGYQSSDYVLAGSQSYVPVLPGDFNLDGHVNAADIPAMLVALTDLNSYESLHGLTHSALTMLGDLNGDQAVTNADIQPLLNLLAASGAAPSVPEPAGVLLAACGFAGLVACAHRRRRRAKA
jgi:hypothetical protein